MAQAAVKSYKDLLVWQEAMALAEAAYPLAAALPDTERFALSAQMRRASVSIPSNIAEGYARGSKGAYAQHLKIARGSLRELETQIMLASRLTLVGAPQADSCLLQCDRVGRLLHGLIKSLDDA